MTGVQTCALPISLERIESAAMFYPRGDDLPAVLYEKFIWHSAMFMRELVDYDFKVIDFGSLSEYIPRDMAMMQSVTNSKVDESLGAAHYYRPNYAYTLDSLVEECEIYKMLMESRERISVEEWKELTL